MDIGSLYFLIFIIFYLVCFYALKKIRFWIIFIFNSFFLVSYIANIQTFISFCLIFLVGYALTFFFVSGKREPKFLYSALIIYVLIFIILKKYEFLLFILSDNILSHSINIIGFSYIFFKQIHLWIDVNDGLIKKEQLSFGMYYNYLFGFYTLLAGPIQRYPDFYKQFNSSLNSFSLNDDEFISILNRIINGCFKFLVIFTIINNYINYEWFILPASDKFTCWIKGAIFLYGYFFYYYINFSGYCDIIIGIGRLSGLSLPENFNRPYLARNMIEFWERWHISLSVWLRDYLFNPFCKFLFKRKFSNSSLVIGFTGYFFTFFIAGLWHGSALSSVYYGFIFGVSVFNSKIN